MTTRRRFIQLVPVSGVALIAACSDKAPPLAPAAPAAAPAAAAAPVAAPPVPAAAPAATGPAVAAANVDEKDPTAASLGYVADATRADKVKFPKYAADQACAGCALYQGTAGAESGPCPLYGGKLVNAKGWCSSWVKKA